MHFAKSAILLSLVALSNVVVASTPACLLSAVGSQENPADLKAICVTNVDKVKDTITEKCGDKKKEALDFFSDVCASAGHKNVVDSSSTSSASGTTATSTGSKSTGTGFVTSTSTSSASDSNSSGSSGTSSSSSSSSSPSPSDSVSAGASDRHVSAAAFAAVVFVGFAATL
ncbi:hypothetical protein ASPWEDRAFT_178952 [Aspergillus wentii DTO 134E9]|uniref:Extracellular membrane protein CFEM domain-containing protein n=1 Tax=Aspergillus wentii DTO 134E9 TaxID=1073089 RepID=A0A1L9S210_ASPWE|nr:uncharacterized protein ASPWEDRAFT_178952 [Aspergillus wentii DTO 134E9]KAI9923963.1 hypothetical protein MW887_007421 [Aspergillus wentii]OJJ41190.1 hypothetical protein ASPWEDRAFT_178952 [Aspergillus wentii DTO 134E9]